LELIVINNKTKQGKTMNHIELYEKVIKDLTLDFDIRHMMKQIYVMPIEQATLAITLMKEMVDKKTTSYMTE
jgi:hypothetical protein